jgi:signal transduction histidine kinase
MLTEEEKIDFFRVCQEALSNVMYYAAASEVHILLKGSAKEVFLSVSDNGKGFDISNNPKHSGLASMKGRADSINAVLSVKSVLGEGTKITICKVRS